MELLIASIIAFATTNIDDIVVLTLFFGNKTHRSKDIIIGQYIGIGGLIAISFGGSFAGLLIDKPHIGLLGLLPIFLGIKGMIKLFKVSNENTEKVFEEKSANTVFSVAAVTFANGGDNIGIYIPLYATSAMGGKLIMILIFLIMTGLWCIIGRLLSKHPTVAKGISRYGHIITPVMLIVLGLYILYESGSFNLVRY
jgi:cadmium resistance transport/sequestration family protein